MFARIVFSAVLAGLFAGLALTALQRIQVVPIILQAESYEGGTHTHSHDDHNHSSNETHEHDHSSHWYSGFYSHLVAFQNSGSNWQPTDDTERTLYTAFANVLVAIGFALFLAAILSLRQKTSLGQGLLWGLAGYVTFFALPSLGIPPELPGSPKSELVDRQAWWFLTAFCTAIGLALTLLQKNWIGKIIGAILIVLPFIIGAPPIPTESGNVPEELLDLFTQATAIANGVFWLILGVLTTLFFNKLSRTNNPEHSNTDNAPA